MSHIGLSSRDAALIGVSIAALIGITSFRLYEHFQISGVRARVHQAHDAAYYTGELIENLLDAETGQRGYLITGSVAYLQPYNAAMEAIPRALTTFRDSTKAVGVAPEQCLRIQQAVDRKLQELSTTVSLYRRGQRKAAIDLLRSDLGNRLMAQLRKDCDSLRSAYFRLAEQESMRVDKRNMHGVWISCLGNGAVAIILIFAGIRLNESFTQKRNLLDQVSESGRQYQLLAERLDGVREDERADLAREIHDVLGQSLTAIKLDLTMTMRHLTKPDHDAAATTRTLKQAAEETDELIRSLRRISSGLRPALLDQLGLFATIEACTQEWQQRTGIKTEVQLPSTRINLTPKQRIALFRIFQESLTNIVRHANASNVTISASIDSGFLKMEIQDDGAGFEPAIAARKSLGLLGMQERARLIGADLSFESTPGQGAIVHILFPLQEVAAVDVRAQNDGAAYSAG